MADPEAARPLLAQVLIREEGLRLKPYRCSAGVPTIGVGATTYLDGRPVTMRDPPITREQAMHMLEVDCRRRVDAVLDMVDHEATTHQVVALASLAYNIGDAGLRGSTVLRQHRARNHEAAGRAFALWDKVRDPVTKKLAPNKGLTARRAREAALYLTPDADDDAPVTARMPQAVEGESRLVASPIAQGGAVTAGAGVLAAVSQAGDQVGAVGTVAQQAKAVAVDTLGIPADWFLPLVLVAAGAAVVWHRWQQRRQGWA